MIRERGQVVAAGGGLCRVRIRRHGACAGCDISRGCGAGLLARALPGRTADIACHTPLRLEAGQEVEVGLPERGLISAAALVYLVPVLALLAAAALAAPWGDAVAVPAGMTGFLAALLVARMLARKVAGHGAFLPVVLEARQRGAAATISDGDPPAR